MIENKLTVLQVVRDFSSDHVFIKSGFYNSLKVLQNNGCDAILFSRELVASEKKTSLHGGFYEKFQIFRRFEKLQNVNSIDEQFGNFLDSMAPDIVHFHSFESFSSAMIDECKKRDIPMFLSVYNEDDLKGDIQMVSFKKVVVENPHLHEKLKEFYKEYYRHSEDGFETHVCSESKKHKVSIVMPTYNGEEFLETVLDKIKNQKTDFSFELIVVDSGSTDRTVEIINNAKVPNCSFYTIKKGTFNHGLTRNFGVSKSCSEIVVLLTQDAVPVDENWLANIVKHYDDKDIVAGYVRQIPRENCNLIIGRRVNQGFTGSETSYVTEVFDFKKYDSLSIFEKYKATNFDDVCSSFRRSFWEKNPYKATNFAEDLRFGIDVILSGEKIFYTAETAVIHSHNYSFSEAYKRFHVSFLVVLEYYDLANVPGMKALFQVIVSSVKSDVKFIRGCKVSLREKIYHFYFLFFFNILTAWAQFRAYRDFQEGKIKM